MTKPNVYIETIDTIGREGFYEATISFKNHGEAIRVLGQTLDECVRRAITICNVFLAEGKNNV